MAVNIEPDNKAAIAACVPVCLRPGSLAEKLRAYAYPTNLLIDAFGRIVHFYAGPVDAAGVQARIGRPLQNTNTQGSARL